MVFEIIFPTEATFKMDSQGSSKQQILIASLENQYFPVTINLLQSTYALVQNVCALVYDRKIWFDLLYKRYYVQFTVVVVLPGIVQYRRLMILCVCVWVCRNVRS